MISAISKANHSISQKSKSMSWRVMLKRLKLSGSLKTYKLQELTPPKDVLFIIGDRNAKVGCLEISGVTDSWSTKWSRAKASRILPRERTSHSKHPLPTKQNTTLHMDITRWSTPKSYGLCSLQLKMEKLYTVSKKKTRNWLWLRSWTPYCQIKT